MATIVYSNEQKEKANKILRPFGLEVDGMGSFDTKTCSSYIRVKSLKMGDGIGTINYNRVGTELMRVYGADKMYLNDRLVQKPCPIGV